MVIRYARGVGRLLACALAVASIGCGGASYARSPAAEHVARSPIDAASEARYRSDDGRVREESSTRYAQAETGQAPNVASDATSQPLLIYQAELGMAVHQVSANQDRVEAVARELGGFLASRTDDTIVVRVPARAFEEAMARIRELGDVLSRRVEVQDVTEEFRDVETRIRTLEAMRRRVEELLAQARDVQAALAVEQHLERITVQLEQLRGRLRFLADRVAFSTITVRFRERTEARAPHFELPFPWLRQLGLQRLLRL